MRDEAAGDIDALLLAARKCRRRQRPKPLRDVKTQQHVARTPGRHLAADAASKKGPAYDIDRGDTRYDPQKLAHIRKGEPADLEDRARLGQRNVDPLLIMSNQNLAARAFIIAIKQTQQR